MTVSYRRHACDAFGEWAGSLGLRQLNPAAYLTPIRQLSSRKRYDGVCDNAAIVVTFRSICRIYGTVAQALRKWPQYQQINWRFFPFGNSRYKRAAGSTHSRMTAGFELKVRTHIPADETTVRKPAWSRRTSRSNPSDMRDLYHSQFGRRAAYFLRGMDLQVAFRQRKVVSNRAGVIAKSSADGRFPDQSYSSGRPLSITRITDSLGSVLFQLHPLSNKVVEEKPARAA